MEKHVEEIYSSHEIINHNDNHAANDTSRDTAEENRQPDTQSKFDWWLLPGTILLGILIGSALAIGHHAWLKHLNGRQVNLPGDIRQSWIVTINNGWAYAVKMLLTTSLALALPQMIWFCIRRSQYSVEQIDSIMSLPSISNVIWMPSIWLRSSPVLAITLVILATPLISIKVPTALTVVPSPSVERYILVPNVFLNNEYDISAVQYFDGQFIEPRQSWRRVVQRAMMSPTVLPWSPPQACQAGCNYTIEYTSPAINCTDISADDVSDDAFKPGQAYLSQWRDPSSGGSYIYNYSGWQPQQDGSELVNFLNFTIAYANSSLVNGSAAIENAAGLHCVVHNATYLASIAFANGSLTATTKVQKLLGRPVDLTQLDASTWGENERVASSQKFNETQPLSNLLAIMYSFTELLTGTINLDDSGWIHFDHSDIALTPLFATGRDVYDFNFVGNGSLNTALVGLLGNVTLAFMTKNLGTANVTAHVEVATNQYSYNPVVLWSVYGPAIFVTILCSVFGLLALLYNGHASNMSFSQIIETTVRSSDGDSWIAKGPRWKKTKLKFEKSVEGARQETRGFVVHSN